MPNLFRFRGYCLYFWSNEGTEPVHVHVALGRPQEVSTKFWILSDGSVVLAKNGAGISSRTIKQLEAFICKNSAAIIDAWRLHYSTNPTFYDR